MSFNLYIVIVTYNGMKWIESCLYSIPNIYNIVIVDNNSTDGTVSFIKNNYPRITLLEEKKNLGFGGGNNLGISYAVKNGADYVFLLNQDAYLNSDTIDNLVKAHKSNSNYGILSPVHLNGSGNALDWNFSTYLEKNDIVEIEANLNSKNCEKDKIYEVPFVNAAAWLLPIHTINTIGGFDPIFFHYGEDNNYCQRVSFHGLKIGVVSNTFIKHDRIDRGLNPNISLEDALKKREKEFKVNWADITKNKLFEALQRKKNLFRKLIFSVLKFNFKDVHYKWAEIKLINKIVPEIKKSKKKNTKKGRHYINE